MSTAIRLHTPAERKRFHAEFEIARAGMSMARLGLKALEDAKLAAATEKRTRRARLDVGRALAWMHSTNAWQEDYKSWAELCRALGVARDESYKLMNAVAVVDSLPVDVVVKLPEDLSQRQIRALKVVDQPARDATVREAAETGNMNDAFRKLREGLEASPAAEIDDEEPAQPKASNGLAWVKRLVTSLFRWFDARGLGAEAKPLLDALVELAGRAITKSA